MALTLRNVSKSFGNLAVLKKISFELGDGELLVLLGSSGCGKSTLLRLVAGLEDVTEGEIYLNNDRIEMLPPKERGVAMVFQNYSLYPHMSVGENLAFPLKIAKIPKHEIRKKVEETAEMLGLTEKLSTKPGELSGGQRQRVALGRALIRKPNIFLLDEPLSNLDADLRARMRQEIVSLQKQFQVTTIHVTHDQAEALSMADRIALLNNGEIEQIGRPEELYKQPDSVFAAQFLGFPKMNVIKGRVVKGTLQPFNLQIDESELFTHNPELLIGIRPEDIKITAGGEYSAKVLGCEYFGEQYVITIKFDESALTISSLKAAVRTNDEINFTLTDNSLHYFDLKTQKRLKSL
ncbi:MAG: ABC transporter ATP-binding protein [Calditrichaeota bacterium]|nr:MAG: ABC transporter ATP-binding protein [Calditrichota bacterium]